MNLLMYYGTKTALVLNISKGGELIDLWSHLNQHPIPITN